MGMGNIATTGMQAAMSSMEVTSNNIANAKSWGFKSSTANFSDLYSSGVNVGSTQIGMGVQLTSVQQNFAPGDQVGTQSASDLSINSNGFFILRDASSGALNYSRNGHFNFSNGYLMLGNQRLQAYPAVNGAIPSGVSPTDLFVNMSSLPAQPSTTVTQQNLNLNANDPIPATTPFNPSDDTSFDTTNTATVYDSLGNPTQCNLYYVKTAANTWTVNVQINGTQIGTGTLTFNSSGALSTSTGLSNLSFNPTTGAASPQKFLIDMTGSTQLATADAAGTFLTNGYSAGPFQSYSIDANGMVNVQYNNGQPPVLAGQVALANFQSPEGLQDVGNGCWTSTTTSGSPMVSQANSANNITDESLETSNVDLASEMVNLIDAQSTFQANAQVDQVYNQVMESVTKI